MIDSEAIGPHVRRDDLPEDLQLLARLCAPLRRSRSERSAWRDRAKDRESVAGIRRDEAGQRVEQPEET